MISHDFTNKNLVVFDIVSWEFCEDWDRMAYHLFRWEWWRPSDLWGKTCRWNFIMVCFTLFPWHQHRQNYYRTLFPSFGTARFQCSIKFQAPGDSRCRWAWLRDVFQVQKKRGSKLTPRFTPTSPKHHRADIHSTLYALIFVSVSLFSFSSNISLSPFSPAFVFN